MTPETLGAKLEKVQRMMEGATTPGEAEAAALAFQRVMLRHNLTELEAARLTGKGRESIVMQHIVVGRPRQHGVMWRSLLLSVLAQMNFCRYYAEHVEGSEMTTGSGVIFGTRENITAVGRLYLTTVATFERMAVERYDAIADDVLDAMPKELAESLRSEKRFMKELRKALPNKRTWTREFYLGVVSGLFDKLREERDAELANIEGASALVTLADAEMDEAVANGVSGITQKAITGRIKNSDAFMDGYEQGRNWNDVRAVPGEERLAIAATV